MHAAARELCCDLARREISDLDIVEAGDGAAIVAGAAGLRQGQPGAGEERFGVFLQPALGGDGDDERRGHDAISVAPPESPSTQTEKPTAGIGAGEPSWVISPS